MNNLNMYCITVNDGHIDSINQTGYTPVGLGNNINSKKFLRDLSGINISKKNPFYGEYTFHYWLWKNKINDLDNKWIGFCQYRKFWVEQTTKTNVSNFNDLDKILLKSIPKSIDNYESIIGEPFYVNQFRFSKFIKKNFTTMLKRPILFFDKSKRNLEFHFDMMHGHGNLSKAIDLLDSSEREDFKSYVKNSVWFSPHNMFICKSKEILIKYYESVFPWLERCENKFGFKLEGYGLKRIYGFLAERYMSYWFQKYTKFKLMPILFKDISDF